MRLSDIEPNTINSINNEQAYASQTKSSSGSSVLDNTQSVEPSSIELKYAERNENTPLEHVEQLITKNVALLPIKITDTTNLNAKDYVYLGSSEITSFSDMGVTLNKQGALLLIKGHVRDVISGVCHKHAKGREYSGYTVVENEGNETKRFNALYIDDLGRLIATNKTDNLHYEIRFEKNEKVYNNSGKIEDVKISYRKVNHQTPESLSFQDKNKNKMVFIIKNDSLYLSKYINIASKYNHQSCEYKLAMPFGDEYKVLSAKKTRNSLQIETLHSNKKRIFYIDPEHISFQNKKVKKTSHKPPQNLVHYLGHSPYEKYDSGQPFSSTRWGNFSSDWMFIFSSTIDNFRVNVKKSKDEYAKSHHIKSIAHGIKAIDPGIRASINAIKKVSSAWKAKIKDSNDIEIITKMRKEHEKFMSKLPDSVVMSKNFSDALTELMDKTGPKDRLELNNISKLALFAGIARGGYPFNLGFFFGLVAGLSKTHKVVLSRTNNDDICFSFENTVGASLTGLAGTGQGAEKVIFNRSGLDLLTGLPYEANVILSGSINKGRTTSFDIKNADLEKFITHSDNPNTLKYYVNENMEDILINRVNEYSGRLFIEARAPEVRLQAGKALESKDYVVAPRLAAGVVTTLELASVNHKNRQQISIKHQNKKQLPSETELSLLSLNIEGSGEEKIMPIKFIDIDGKDFYSPLPVVESVQRKSLYKTGHLINKKIKHINYTESENVQFANTTLIDKIEETMNDITEQKTKQRDINKLTDVKMIYQTKRKTYPWQEKNGIYIKDLLPESSFRNNLSKIKNELLSKNRNSFDKGLEHSFLAIYKLEQQDYDKLNQFKTIINSIKENRENLTEGQNGKALKNLQNEISMFKEKTTHKLSSIELYGNGYASKTLSTIFSGVLNFADIQKINYAKHLGSINLEYSEDKISPEKIICDYNFIEK